MVLLYLYTVLISVYKSGFQISRNIMRRWAQADHESAEGARDAAKRAT